MLQALLASTPGLDARPLTPMEKVGAL